MEFWSTPVGWTLITVGHILAGAGCDFAFLDMEHSGNSFDTMGAASAGNNHFNSRYKNYLNWLTAMAGLTRITWILQNGGDECTLPGI